MGYRMRYVWVVAILAMAVFVPAAGAQTPDVEDCGAVYTVQPGDTLTRIARVCGTTVEALREANPDVFSLIKPGDVLTLPSEPMVTITPRQGAAGTAVSVLADGYPPNSPVQVGIGRPGEAALSATTAITDVRGAAALQLPVPQVSDGTDLFITAAGETASDTSEPFTVTATGGVTVNPSMFAPIPHPVDVRPEGVYFNRINVYMLAPNAAPADGFVLGCDEVFVPVQVQVTPTVAPLTAGVQALLDFTAAEYGVPALENPLAGTDLHLQGVNIRRGEAIIALSGQTLSAGVCQDARLIAQLEATALQYNTVDRVSILLNGQPLGSQRGTPQRGG